MNFKASIHDRIVLLVDVPCDFSEGLIPRGTQGTVVERYENPKEGYAVDLEVADRSALGGFRYENVVLLPDQFGIVR
jgi:hypothetical protein